MEIVDNMSRHLIVIGGGAAGFFCAVTAARLDPSLRGIVAEFVQRNKSIALEADIDYNVCFG